MSGKRLHIVIGLFLILFTSSCSLNRFVPEGQYLVKKNTVIIEEINTKIDKSKLSSYISLKPYKETFQTNFPVWIYYKKERNPQSGIWKWMYKNFGKEPVYYEKSEANRSAEQMMRHLDNIGYFHSKVSHTVDKKRKKAKVTYLVTPSRPYYVNKIDYIIEDSLIKRYALYDSLKFPLKEGDVYNAYSLDEQREIITERLRNSGYYYFNRDNIFYEVDSNFMDHTLNITMKLKNNKLANRKYYIRDISVYPNFSVFRMNDKPTDTAALYVELGPRKYPNTLDFYYFGKPQVKPQTFSRSINLIEGFPYSLRSVTSTYKALSNFRLFSNINIEFDSVSNPNDSLHLLDCRVTMQQNDVHSFTVQAEGTNSDGDLGIKGSFSYINKNIFHGAETFQLSLKAGLEAQKVVGTEQTENGQKVFNTSEFGVTASLLFPKFLSLIPFGTFSRDYQPTTTVSLGFNSQIRYYYSRYISSLSFSYDWKSNYRRKHTLSPVYLNSVKIANLNPVFEEYLQMESSQRKKDQYTDHLLFGLRYSYIYNSQSFNKKGSFLYFRADFESSGNLLSLFNKTKLITENEGHHELFGIQYAQYLRGSFDLREHIDLGQNSWFVMRQFAGIGLPYGNSMDLPFERSFYCGGANGLRGWHYRSIGPGGYQPSDNDIERVGDIHLEFNAEYRFPIHNIFNGAVFVDAGNVWTYQYNEFMPNSNFTFNNFYKQLAVDMGFGIRVDVSFLILRIDMAYAMRNPYPDSEGNYWRFEQTDNLMIQAGIGYPF